MTIRNYKTIQPRIAASAYIDETALVIGDVDIGDDVSIWPMCTIRGDVNSIIIGARTNIQDGSILHVTHSHESIPGGYGLDIGKNITVGHRAVLHGCTIEDNCLIGMGSIVMDGVLIKSYVLLGAGSLVPPGKVLDAESLWVGSPAKKVRALTQQELEWIEYSAGHYVGLKNSHLSGGD